MVDEAGQGRSGSGRPDRLPRDSRPVNPYIAGAPVSGPDMFYGRDDVFDYIRRKLMGQHRDTPIVLKGERRTGKTSVLYQVHRHLDSSYHCVSIDLHGIALNGLNDLLSGIASLISDCLAHDCGLDVAPPARDAFDDDPRAAFESLFLPLVLEALGRDHLVLMLDEVVRLDEQVRAGRLDRSVFGYLRHLMQHYPQLNFIFSLGSGLEEMQKDYAFLFSIAMYHPISFLEEAAARKLISDPARGYYEVSPDAVEAILRVASRHPYYTQLVCHGLFDRWMTDPDLTVMTAEDVESVLGEAIELGSANLTHVWGESSPGEKAVMAAMAEAMRSRPHAVTSGEIRNVWRQAGVRIPEGNLSSAIRSLVSREVIFGHENYSFAIDLQRLWLDKHRRLDWLKDELAGQIRQWNGESWSSRVISRRRLSGRSLNKVFAAVKKTVVRWRTYAVPAAAISCVIGLAVYGFDGILNPASCGSQVAQGVTDVVSIAASGRCVDVGVTDGTYELNSGSPGNGNSDLVKIERAIAQEDRKVRSDGPYSSIVYLLPSPGNGYGADSVQDLVGQLQGAYAAQMADNSLGGAPDGPGPHVQLLIAFSGVDYSSYKKVDSMIFKDVKSQHVGGVVGIGDSWIGSSLEVKELAGRYGIPVVGDSIAPGGVNGVKGVMGIVPSAQQEASGLWSYYRYGPNRDAVPSPGPTILVGEINSEDSYSREFENAIKATPLGLIVSLESPRSEFVFNSTENLRNESAGIYGAACAGSPVNVLFIGSASDLNAFLSMLGERRACDGVTVITGDDAGEISISPTVRRALDRGVRIYYSGRGEIGEFINSDNSAGINSRVIKEGFDSFKKYYQTALGLPVSTVQGVGAAFDEVRVEIRAIRLAVRKQSVPYGGLPSPKQVENSIFDIGGKNSIYGADGLLSFSGDYSGASESQNMIPIMSLGRTGSRVLLGVVVVPPGL